MKSKNYAYKIFVVFNIIIMLAVLLITFLPYLHVLAKALNDGNDTMLGGITFFPRKLTFMNFKVLLAESAMIKAFFISISRVALGTMLGLFVQFMGAYALTRDVPGKNKIMVFLIIPMFFNGGMIPTYLLCVKLGLINNFWVYILPMLGVYYNVLIIKSYIISSIPESLNEAALLDGASEIVTLFKIILPLSKPVLATVALWVAVSHWNDWTTTMLYVTHERLFTLQYKLMQLIKESERLQSLIREAAMSGDTSEIANVKATPESLVSAQVIVTTIPIVILYPFLQKYFVQGITLGAVKQ
jgi:putative aldouronate transport system permease protein